MSASTRLLAGLPPGSNPFAYLRTLLNRSTSPAKPQWFFHTLYALSGLYAVLLVLVLVGLIVRKRRSTLWMIKRTPLPSGNLISCHAVNWHSVLSTVWYIVVQVYIWRLAAALAITGDDHLKNVFRIAPLHGAWLAFTLCGWFDMAGSVAAAVTAHFRLTGKTPRLLSVPILHAFLYVIPLVCSIALVSSLIGLAVHVHRYLAITDYLDGLLANRAAQWTSGLPIDQLLALAPPAEQWLEASEEVKLAIRILYIIYSIFLTLLIFSWTPINIHSIKTLLQQIATVRNAVAYKEDEKEDKGVFTGHSIVRNEAKKLIRVCIWRILSVVLMTLCCVYFFFCAIWLAVDPFVVEENEVLAPFFIIGSLVAAFGTSACLTLSFFVQAFDTSPSARSSRVGQSAVSPRLPVSPTIRHTKRALSSLKTLVPIASRSSVPTPTGPLCIQVELETAIAIDVAEEKEEDVGRVRMLG